MVWLLGTEVAGPVGKPYLWRFVLCEPTLSQHSRALRMHFKSAIFAFLVMAGCTPPADNPDPSHTWDGLLGPGFAPVGKGRLFFELTGSGTPLVLIHGNAGDRRHWDAQVDALAEEFLVIRYDVRGYGRSSIPNPGVEYSDHGDLAGLLDFLRIDAAHIAGWSMGSGIAVDFALAYPSRTLSLISVSPWIFGYTSDAAQQLFSGISSVSEAFLEGGPEGAVHAWMTAPFFAPAVRDSAAANRFAGIAQDYSWWAFVNSSARVGIRPSAEVRLREIDVPSLVLVGEHDIEVCREIAVQMARSIRRSRRIEIPGAGHLLLTAFAREVNTYVLEFLRAVDGA